MKKIFTKFFMLAVMSLTATTSWAQCYVYGPSGEISIKLKNSTQPFSVPGNGLGGVLSYKYRIDGGLFNSNATSTHYATAEWSEDGSNWNVLKKVGTKSKSYGDPATATLPEAAKYFRITASGEGIASRTVYVTEVNISSSSYLKDPSISEWSASNTIGSSSSTTTATMKWCYTPAITYELKGNGASQFSCTINNNAVNDCGEYGTATINLSYNHDVVGTHTATLSLSSNGKTYNVALTGTTTQQAQTITWNDDIANIKTTDNITLNATATTAISYTSSDNSIAEIVGNTLSIKKHGKVTITATAAETDIYASASQTKEVTISAAAPEVTSWPKVTPITYGTPLTLDMLVGGNAKVPGNFECAELPTTLNAGTHKISVRFVPENQNIYTIVEEKIDIIVKKADATITTIPNAINDLAYSGEEQTLITEGSAEGGKIVYSLDGNTFTENVPTATNAGEYTVYYKVVGDENHNDVEGTNSIVVTIKKAILTITAEDKSVTYGEEAPTYSATYSGWKAQDNEDVLVGEMTFECEYNTNSNVGTYDINISGVEAQNYEITFVSGVLTVNKADATITNTPNAINDLVYSGEEQTLITEGSAEGGKIVYSLDGNTFTEDVPTATNAGEYTVYYKVIGDENHNDVEETNSIVVIIKKATQSITWNDNIENIQTIDNITLNAIANTDIHYTSSDSTIAYIENKTLIINKYGIVTITAIARESNNYTQAIESKDITISRATPSITWNISDTLIVGNSIHLDAVASNNAEVLYEIIGEEGILKYDNQTETLTAIAAGTTTILAYTEENDIYNAAEYQYTITVVLDSNPSTNITNTTINGEKAQKIFVNGELYIIRNNQWYDTTGKLVK